MPTGKVIISRFEFMNTILIPFKVVFLLHRTITLKMGGDTDEG